jgi:hypothetical protein
MSDNRVYGELETSEDFSKRLKHLMDMQDDGFPMTYYRDKFNRVRIKHGQTWWVMGNLAKHIPSLRVEGLDK